MAFTYSQSAPSSNLHQVRLLIGDVDGSQQSGPREEWSYFLTDGEIGQLLTNAGNDVNIAASKACIILSALDLMLYKAVTLGRFKTTNEASKHWRALAEVYREEAGLDAGFDWAEIAWTPDNADLIVKNKALRGETD